MKEKHLRIVIYVVGTICLYAFLAIRFFPLINFVLNEKMDPETRDFNKYGDLYYYNCITHFKQDFPQPLRKYRLSKKNPQVNEANILTFGDSFFDFSFHKTFPERLADTLRQKVYSFVTQDPAKSNPFCILNSYVHANYDQSRYVIFETIERNIPLKFEEPYDPECIDHSFKANLYNKAIGFFFKSNSEKLYALMLKRGYLVNNLYSLVATLRFDLFGYISPLTSKYKMGKDPWLFYSKEYSDEPGGFYYHYSCEDLDKFANNILLLSKLLKSEFNLNLIFMPIPNKYSIYHSMVDYDHYNDFLPQLYVRLDERGIYYIDLYSEYKKSPDTLYYGTDTHWNKKGVDIALHLTLEKLNSDKSMAQVYDPFHKYLTRHN